MVFFCESAQCWAHDSKRKNPDKWGWMKDVTWVKFPTDASTRATWLRLIRRKDKVNLTKKSRLCSRHFDRDQITPDGHAKGYPRYFFWNNFGLTGEERPTTAIDKMDTAREVSARKRQQTDSDIDPTSSPVKAASSRRVFSGTLHHPALTTDDNVIGTVGSEVEVESRTRSKKAKPSKSFLGHHGHVGHMDALPENLRHSDQHDYLSSAEMKPMVQEVQTQTDMTCEDIASLVKASTRKFKSRAEDTVDCVLDSDERVNFYTGLESRTLLNGVWDSISDGVSKMKYWTGPESMKEKQYEKKGYKKPGQQRHLDPFFEFVMTLMRIRLNLPLLLLADLFSVSATCVTKTTITWIAYLHQTLVPALLIWPSQLQVRSRMPFEFKKYFPRTRVVIDCT
ncbi:uncharacterized protein LOC129274430 [Lytechinus pictus]|uniref:uncharacterized protein LOC129274430 n=1 Tax=Lytechinus pictus TaxID=7653 RepID=UPI0030B9EA2F